MTFVPLKNNFDYRHVYEVHKSKANRLFVMYIAENSLSCNRIGISVSKKVGNSVIRHHVKRLVKENLRLADYEISGHNDIVIIARTSSKDADFYKVGGSLLHLFKLHHLC